MPAITEEGPPLLAPLFVHTVPVPEPLAPAKVGTSFTVTDVGTTPVRVLEVRSALTPRWTVWSGVTRQEQHDTNSSLGSNAYTLTQMFPAAAPKPGPGSEAPFAPSFAMSM